MPHHPTDAEAGAEDLGEGAQQHNLAGAVEFIDGALVSALVAQFAVGAVLDDEDVVLVGDGNDLLAALFAHGHAGGVLEVRDHIDELWFLASGDGFLDPGFHDLGIFAFLVHGDADHVRPVGIERAQAAQVRG